VALGDWRFWSADQGLTATIHDVSADDGGNVYVAGGEAVFAKRPGTDEFLRFDAANSDLTKNCYGSDPKRPNDGVPANLCPVISVAGSTTPGKAFLGFKGAGSDDDRDQRWAIRSGGLDVVTFDGAALRRERHVLVASPPGYVCEDRVDATSPCPNPFPGDTWADGRFKGRQIHRIVVNRTEGLGRGDAIFGGTHGGFSVLVANPEARGWDGFMSDADLRPSHAADDTVWSDARYVFEHLHPAVNPGFLYGETWAHAIDPLTGTPWFATYYVTTNLRGYATMTRPEGPTAARPTPNEPFWGAMHRQERQVTDPITGAITTERDFLRFFGTRAVDPVTGVPEMDNVQSLSFCADGTLWAGSLGRGLARVRLDAARLDPASIDRVSVKGAGAGFDDAIFAVACDPSDGSVWVGLAWTNNVSQILRLKNGAWSMVPQTAPEFAKKGPVRSIQIDTSTTPRTVWFAHQDWVRLDPTTRQVVASGPGGVSAYQGP
jgi:hypothetical protein